MINTYTSALNVAVACLKQDGNMAEGFRLNIGGGSSNITSVSI